MRLQGRLDTRESGSYEESWSNEDDGLLESNPGQEVASHRVPRGEVRRPGSRDSETTVSSVICLGGERQRGRLVQMLKEHAGEEYC